MTDQTPSLINSQGAELCWPPSGESASSLCPVAASLLGSPAAVKLDHISKIYRLYDKPIDRLKESLHPGRKKYHHDFYALRDISLQIAKGESLGIIGRNGCGKSTLLKIITGILTPSSGHVSIQGKVSALLELGAGFNPELSGIENVYFAGTIMGFTKAEMDQRIEEILTFADIGEFIYQPVKVYSSGMYVRLAFAVAIHVEPEVLVLDEALAVGDMRFQQKCFRKIKEFKEKEKTILLVSHDMGAVINFCSKALWLREGEIYQFGRPDDVCKEYVAYMSYDSLSINATNPLPEINAGRSDPEEFIWEDVESCSSFGEGGAEIKRVTLCAKDSRQQLKIFEGGMRVQFFLEVETKKEIDLPIVGIILKDEYGRPLLGINNYIYGIDLKPLPREKRFRVAFEFEFPRIRNGRYSISASIAEGTQMNHIQHHWVHDAYLFQIVSHDIRAQQEYSWIIDRAEIDVINLSDGW